MKQFLILLTLALIVVAHSRAMAQPNPIPNSGFEDWTSHILSPSVSIFEPDGWYDWDTTATEQAIFKSTDAHSGRFAMGGRVIEVGKLIVPPTVTTGGQSILNSGMGFPIDHRPANVEGYYKFTSVGGDEIAFFVDVTAGGSPQGEAMIVDSISSTEYKHFDEPINYFAGDVPDTGIIYIVIENPHGSVHLGSSFVIDDLAIEGVGSDPFIYVQSGSKYQFKLEDNFPNPCTSLSTIRYSIPEVESVTLSIFDMLGTPVAILENGIEPAGPHEVSFYSEHLPSGLYLCKLQSSSGEVVSRAIQVVH